MRIWCIKIGIVWILQLLRTYWLIIYCFTSPSRIFHLHRDVTNTGEGLQILGLCSALMAFVQGGIYIVPHLLWHGASVFSVSSEGPSHLITSYDLQEDAEDLFYLGPHGWCACSFWRCLDVLGNIYSWTLLCFLQSHLTSSKGSI
jgi:hypothetical protein